MNTYHDEQYKNKDITIYIRHDLSCSVDIKHGCGELIEGWDHVDNTKLGLSLAKTFIDSLVDCDKSHCEDEYCRI